MQATAQVHGFDGMQREEGSSGWVAGVSSDQWPPSNGPAQPTVVLAKRKARPPATKQWHCVWQWKGLPLESAGSAGPRRMIKAAAAGPEAAAGVAGAGVSGADDARPRPRPFFAPAAPASAAGAVVAAGREAAVAAAHAAAEASARRPCKAWRRSCRGDGMGMASEHEEGQEASDGANDEAVSSMDDTNSMQST